MSIQKKMLFGVFGVLVALILAGRKQRDYFDVEDKTVKQMTIQ